MNAVSLSLDEVKTLSRNIRRTIVKVSHAKKIPHLGSSLSCVDLLVCLYWQIMNVDPNEPQSHARDYFLLSKGHAASALYTVLAFKGFFPGERLFEHGETGSPFEEHPGADAPPGVEVVGGSLGHGLSIGSGMALAAKIQGLSNRFYVLLGDGELNEGTVWEAAMFAATHRLEKLTAIIDCNQWQGTGRNKDIMQLEPLEEKWRAFGWHCLRISGHDPRAIQDAFEEANNLVGKPVAIIADTLKGAGVSFMEDDNNWHYRIPSDEELNRAIEVLDKP